MNSPNAIKEASRIIKTTLAISLGFVGLSSCSEHVLAPSDRYVSDYASFTKYGCLNNSPYRPDNVLVSKDELGSIAVTPITGEIPPLRFDGYEDQDQPLQPTDGYTSSVLEDYGCVSTYGD